MSLKAIDFFCGIGGVTKGFLNKGIDVIAGIDIDKTCKETYEANNKRASGESVTFLQRDITNFDVSEIQTLLGKDDKLILIGCAPCQPFTKITKNLENREKERGLLKCFSDIILKLSPEYIFLENVQGLTSPDNKAVLYSFIDSLKPDYNLTPEVINAASYGVPQTRKRIILFGKKKGVIEIPTARYGRSKKIFKTLLGAIGDLPHIKAGEKHKNYQSHISAKLSDISLERLKYQKKPGDGMEFWPPHLQLNSRKKVKYSGHKDVYARLRWNKPSGTLTTKFVSISNGRFAHPTQDRGLSILEGLIIQSFPRSFKLLYPSIRTQARQIGNAVPVKVAEAFAQKIIETELNKSISSKKQVQQASFEFFHQSA